MSRSVRRGLIAGAMGTVVLNAVTYLDMALRGRPASGVPARLAHDGLDLADVEVGDEQAEALGALAGIATGLGVGVAVSVGRAHGVRLSTVTGSVLAGALAMAASDVPVVALGISDPRDWAALDWASDVVPHLAYGVATHAVIRGQEMRDDSVLPQTRPTTGLVLRSLALGVATGGRSSLGLVGAAFAGTGGRLAKTGSLLSLATELVVDKRAGTSSRLDPGGIGARVASACVGSVAFAAEDRATVDLPALAGAAGAVLGSVAGAAWRERAARNRPDWQGALVEDAAALGLTWLACRRS